MAFESVGGAENRYITARPTIYVDSGICGLEPTYKHNGWTDGQPDKPLNILKLSDQDIRLIESRVGIKIDQVSSCPLFITGSVKNVRPGQLDDTISFELDSGSDRCIISKKEANRLGVKMELFDDPKCIKGLNSKITCEFYCILNLQFVTLDQNDFDINVICYIIDTSIPNLLGNDVFKAVSAKINYENYTVSMYDHVIRIAPTIGRKEAIHVCSQELVDIPPRHCALVPFSFSSEAPFPCVLIGVEDDDKAVMNAYCKERGEKKEIAVINKRNTNLTIPAGLEMGFLLVESDTTDIINFTCLLNSMGSDKVLKTDSQTDNPTTLTPLTSLTNDTLRPCPIPKERKPTEEECLQFYQHGPLIEPVSEKEAGISCRTNERPLETIDRDKELLKSINSTIWPSRSEFLSNFKFEAMELHLLERESEATVKGFQKN